MSITAAPVWLIAALAAGLLSCTSAASAGQVRPFAQLISTRYAPGAPLPADAARPAAAYDFVDRSLLPAEARVRSAAKAGSGAILVVTDRGSYRIAGGRAQTLREPVRRKPMQPETTPALFRAVTSDADGHVWVASTNGLFVTDGDQWWQPIDHLDGVPFDRMTCLHLAANGDVWGGTTEGAFRLRAGRFRYFWGLRWLPGNRVDAIWSGTPGRTWLQTNGGVACIEERPTTLAEKAAHYDRITQERHNRRGWICHIGLKTPGSPEKGFTQHTEDNDSLWTGYYIGAMALRYAVTKDPAARQQAQQSMNAVLDLERKSGIPGLPARCLITDDEIKAGVSGYSPTAVVHVLGEDPDFPTFREPIWFRSKTHPDTWCKGDTSSDSLNGHCFAWYMYYTHVADAAEKQEIAQVVRRIMDHILRNNYRLIDHTGHQTRWGIWSPAIINEDPDWYAERGLYPLEILAYLTTAYAITGEPRYRDAREDLIRKHHYLLSTLLHRRGPMATWWELNHSDDQLAFAVYYPLMMQEKDPARRRILCEMLARMWEPSLSGENGISLEHASLYNFAYGALTGNPCDAESGVENLRDWPWELVSWDVQNSHRSDVTLKTHMGGGGRSKGDLDRVLPASERAVSRWSESPWEPDAGSAGGEEHGGTPWLLAYWMGVYHGYIAATD